MSIGAFISNNKRSIKVGLGLGAMIVGTIECCKAVKKQEVISDEYDFTIMAIEDPVNNDLSEKEIKKAKRAAKFRKFGRSILNFGPGVLLEALGFGMVTKQHVDISADLAKTSAALISTEALFETYRKNIVEAYGEEADYRALNSVKTVDVIEVDEKGKEHKKKVDVADGKDGLLKRYFIKGENPYWDDDEQYMQATFMRWQNELNAELKASKGKFLSLSKAYDTFGFEAGEDEIGVLAKGWKYDLKNPTGDNFVQVNVHKTNVKNKYGDLVPAYLIEFNCDKGTIL